MKFTILLTFLTIFFTSIQPAPAQSSKTASPKESLEFGRKLMKQERWEEARQQFAKINKGKHGADRLLKAEANFSYGLCRVRPWNVGSIWHIRLKNPKKKSTPTVILEKYCICFKTIRKLMTPRVR